MNTTHTAAAAEKVITLDVIKNKDRKCCGRVHEGEVIEGHRAEIVPGKSITLHGACKPGQRFVRNAVTGKAGWNERPMLYANHFEIGDEAKVGSYNLIYTGIIRKITAKQVWIVEYEGSRNERVHKFDIAKFDQKNWDFDAQHAAEHNSNELMYI